MCNRQNRFKHINTIHSIKTEIQTHIGVVEFIFVRSHNILNYIDISLVNTT